MVSKTELVIERLIQIIKDLMLLFHNRIEWLENKVGEVYTNGVDN